MPLQTRIVLKELLLQRFAGELLREDVKEEEDLQKRLIEQDRSCRWGIVQHAASPMFELALFSTIFCHM